MSAAPRGLSGDFWRFWTGQTISNLGSSFTTFALPLLVFKLTGSALNLGLATAAGYLPYLLFGLLIGAWVDRVQRKRLMIVTDLARAAVIGSVPLLASLDLLSVGWIYAVMFVSSTLSICFNAAEFAAIPSLVPADAPEALVTANGRIQASFSAASVIGPLLAGALAAYLPIADLLVVDAASFVGSAGALALIRSSFTSPDAPRSAGLAHDVLDGLRYVLGHPVLRSISAMMALVNLVGSTVYAQLILFSKQRLLATDSQIGLLFGAGGVGVVVLSLLAGPLRRRWPFSAVALGALMLGCPVLMALSATSSVWVALPLWAVYSGLGTLFNINTASLRQAIVPNHLLGRVVTVAMVLAWSAIPLGAFVGGLVVEWTHDVARVYAAIAVLLFLIPFGFVFSPLGRAERYLVQAHQAAVSRA